MRGEKFREGALTRPFQITEMPQVSFLSETCPASRLRLSRHFLIARPTLLRDAGGAS